MPPDVARIAAAWPAMPEAIRAAVLALAAPYAPADIDDSTTLTADAFAAADTHSHHHCSVP